MSTADLQEWAEGISNQVVEMLVSREIFWKLRDIAQANPAIDKPPLLTGWLADNYTYTQAAAVRRQTDDRKDAVSLMRFMRQAKKHEPRLFTDEEIDADISTLRAATKPVKKYVDNYIAHTNQVHSPVDGDYQELHAAVDVIADIAERYCTRLGCDLLRVTVEQWMDLEGDWLTPLRIPWLTEKDVSDE